MRKPTDAAENSLRHLANSSITICGLARNCGAKLKGNIRFIEKLSAHFQESLVIVVEDGSKDDTRDVLSQWASATKNVIILDGHVSEFENPWGNASKGSPNPFYSFARISKMASLRNQYLEYLNGLNKEFEFLLILDFDVDRISWEGVLNSFSRQFEWDVVTAYGYSTGPNFKERYHDTFALVPLGENERPQTEKSIKSIQYAWKQNKLSMDLIPVYAGFGGLSIYKHSQVKSLRYTVLQNANDKVQVRCEHFSFCDQLQKNRGARIVINPRMHLRYQTIKEGFRNVVKEMIYNLRSFS